MPWSGSCTTQSCVLFAILLFPYEPARLYKLSLIIWLQFKGDREGLLGTQWPPVADFISRCVALLDYRTPWHKHHTPLTFCPVTFKTETLFVTDHTTTLPCCGHRRNNHLKISVLWRMTFAFFICRQSSDSSEAPCSPETSVPDNSIRRHILGDCDLHQERCANHRLLHFPIVLQPAVGLGLSKNILPPVLD
jgi:hypothetical protein